MRVIPSVSEGPGGLGGTKHANRAARTPGPSLTLGMTRERLLIVDDQALVRQGLRALLEMDSDIEVACEAGDGEEASASVKSYG